MRPYSPPSEASMAKDLLDTHGTLSPVPLITLCHTQGLTVRRTTFATPDVAIVVIPYHGLPTIFVDQAASAAHQRFLIAHALAHCVLHGQQIPDNYSLVESYDRFTHSHNFSDDRASCVECRTNRLARAILMPPSKMAQWLRSSLSVTSGGFLLAVSPSQFRQRLRDRLSAEDFH